MSLERAKARAIALAEQGTYRMRKCMCCPTTFLSEGAHHRMCNVCRQNAGASFELAV